MAAPPKENKHSFASIMVVLVLFGTMAALAFIPAETFQAVRAKEQEQIRNWLGHETDQWIMLQILDLLQWANREAGASLDSASLTGSSKIDAWVIQRVYAALVWCHVVMYRGGLLVMWLAFGIPLMLAMALDGHYQREISKASFSSQSPVLHKRGVDLSKAAIAIVVVWLFIPYHITMLVAPVGILMTAIAGWIWVANMQKRL